MFAAISGTAGVVKLYRASNFFYRKGWHWLSQLFYLLNYFLHSVKLPASCKIGSGTNLAHNGFGSLFHQKTIIGKNCYIGCMVLIGGRGKHGFNVVIGNNVLIGARSVILGNVKVNDYSVVAAGSVVLKDVPSFAVVAGNPAKAVKTITKENFSDYFFKRPIPNTLE